MWYSSILPIFLLAAHSQTNGVDAFQQQLPNNVATTAATRLSSSFMDTYSFADQEGLEGDNGIRMGSNFNQADSYNRFGNSMNNRMNYESGGQMTTSLGGTSNPIMPGPGHMTRNGGGNLDSYSNPQGYMETGGNSGFLPHVPHKTISGTSRGLWQDSNNERSQVSFQTPDGRPLYANFEVYQGPNNTPQKMRLWSEDGRARPWMTTVETPRQLGGHTMSVKNPGSLEFPLQVAVGSAYPSSGYGLTGHVPQEELAYSSGHNSGMMGSPFADDAPSSPGVTVQGGGSLKTFSIEGRYTECVKVTLESQGLPVMAVIEVWEGPGHAKQVGQIYSDNGSGRPISAAVPIPGQQGCTVAVKNMGPIAYPFTASVTPY